jgi:hypothetical protein
MIKLEAALIIVSKNMIHGRAVFRFIFPRPHQYVITTKRDFSLTIRGAAVIESTAAFTREYFSRMSETLIILQDSSIIFSHVEEGYDQDRIALCKMGGVRHG